MSGRRTRRTYDEDYDSRECYPRRTYKYTEHDEEEVWHDCSDHKPYRRNRLQEERANDDEEQRQKETEENIRIIKEIAMHTVVLVQTALSKAGVYIWRRGCDVSAWMLKTAITKFTSPSKAEETSKSSDSKCVVCQVEAPTHSFVCGHFCVCETCSAELKKCPLCRRLGSPFKIYK